VLRAVHRERHHVFAVPFYLGSLRGGIVGAGRRSGGQKHCRR